jgi:hypothetical protein
MNYKKLALNSIPGILLGLLFAIGLHLFFKILFCIGITIIFQLLDALDSKRSAYNTFLQIFLPSTLILLCTFLLFAVFVIPYSIINSAVCLGLLICNDGVVASVPSDYPGSYCGQICTTPEHKFYLERVRPYLFIFPFSIIPYIIVCLFFYGIRKKFGRAS